jgi:hypothetical protein
MDLPTGTDTVMGDLPSDRKRKCDDDGINGGTHGGTKEDDIYKRDIYKRDIYKRLKVLDSKIHEGMESFNRDEFEREMQRRLDELIPRVEKAMKDLREKGYAVIEGVLSPGEVDEAKESFYSYYYHEDRQQIRHIHSKLSPHGINKFLGHGQWAWKIRKNPFVKECFKRLWKTPNLVVSFDGCCYLPEDVNKRDTCWTHTDQAPSSEGELCTQAFIALTDNDTRTLVVYEGSHKLHHQYGKDFNVTDKKNWHKIHPDFLESIAHTKRVVSVKAGWMVWWDSRTFHQNQYGNNQEERLVQYICYLPKSGRSEKERKKREKYLKDERTTSHWPYPVSVNGRQPQHYGDKTLAIDYEKVGKFLKWDKMSEEEKSAIMKLI